MILSEKVMITASAGNQKYYEEKGYEIPKRVDTRGVIRVKRGTEIEVLVEDLPKASHVKVMVKCDYCEHEYSVIYKDLLYSRKSIKKDCCSHCQILKTQEVMFLKYGKKNAMQIEIFKDKTKETNLERYNVEYPSQNQDVRDKMKKTCIEKYGCEFATQSKQMKDKAKETHLNRYGVENPSQNQDVKKKIIETTRERYGVNHYTQSDEYKKKYKQTCLDKYGIEFWFATEEAKIKNKNSLIEKYGVSHPMYLNFFKDKIKKTCIDRYGETNYTKTKEYKEKVQITNQQKYGTDWVLQSDVVREKITKTLFAHGKIPCSKQQIHLHQLFGGELNYPISSYWADITLLDERIVIEYDGGGHDLQVKLGNIDEHDFHRKEDVRNNKIINKGYQIFRIISPNDLMLEDFEYLRLFNIIKDKFFKNNCNLVKLDVNNRSIHFDDYECDIEHLFSCFV
jgi:hypothetical protein